MPGLVWLALRNSLRSVTFYFFGYLKITGPRALFSHTSSVSLGSLQISQWGSANERIEAFRPTSSRRSQGPIEYIVEEVSSGHWRYWTCFISTRFSILSYTVYIIRFLKTEEPEKILDWHFRNVDKISGGREGYARRFPVEYYRVDTISGMIGFTLVYEDQGQLTGYIGVRIDQESSPHGASVCGFYVVPQRRLSGYGRALAERAVVVTREKRSSVIKCGGWITEALVD